MPGYFVKFQAPVFTKLTINKALFLKADSRLELPNNF